jgi:hypothetical protein
VGVILPPFFYAVFAGFAPSTIRRKKIVRRPTWMPDDNTRAHFVEAFKPAKSGTLDRRLGVPPFELLKYT